MHSENSLAGHQNLHTNQNLRKKISNFSYHIINDLVYESLYYSLYKGVNETNYNKVNIKVIKIPKKPSSSSSQQIDFLSRQGKGSDKNEIKEYLMLQNYMKNIQKLKHSKIVKLIETYSTANNFYVIYQKFANTTLGRYIQQHKRDKHIVSFRFYARIFVQVYQAVKYLINVGYLIPTISKHSILVKQQKNSKNQTKVSAKISGVGYSIKMVQNQNTFNWQIDLQKHVFPDIDHSIIAPEALSTSKFTIQSKVWSLGVILYESFIGRVPWKRMLFSNDAESEGKNRKDVSLILKSIKQSSIDKQIDRRMDYINQQIQQTDNFNQYEVNPTFLVNLKDLILRCLQISPEKRIKFNEIQKHPFFTKIVSRQVYDYTQQANYFSHNEQAQKDGLFKKGNRINLIGDKGNKRIPTQTNNSLQGGKNKETFEKNNQKHKKQKLCFEQSSKDKKMQVFNSSFSTQFDYLLFLDKLYSLLSVFISQSNDIKLYSLSSQSRKYNTQILFNLEICLAKQILIQVYAMEKAILQKTNQLNFNEDIWRFMTFQIYQNQAAREAWGQLQKRIVQMKTKIVDQNKIKNVFQKWVQSSRIKNFRKLITIANTNFDSRCSTQTEMAGIYYALKFIRSSMKDLYLDKQATNDKELNSYLLKQQMSTDSYFNSLLLFDLILSYYQIICLRFDDTEAEQFGQLSFLEQIVQYMPSAYELLQYYGHAQKGRQTNSFYTIFILKQQLILQRVQILRQKIYKLQLVEQNSNVKNQENNKRYVSEKIQ